jgi:hypothetical protein
MFRDEEHFVSKLRKHYLNPSEPWGRLFGVNFLRQVGQKLREQDVSLVAEAYAQAVEIIDAGVLFAAQQPIFMCVKETVAQQWRLQYRWCYYLLAEAGFKIVAHGGILRSAYFLSKNPQESKYTLFKEAWSAMRLRAMTPRMLEGPAGVEKQQPEVRWFSRQNWTTCPNPHAAPRRTRPPRTKPPGIDEWLDDVAPKRNEISRDSM